MAKTKRPARDFYAIPKRELMLAQPPTEYMSLLEAAQLTRLSPWTLRALIKKRQLRCTRIGRRVLVTRGAIKEMMDRHDRYEGQPPDATRR